MIGFAKMLFANGAGPHNAGAKLFTDVNLKGVNRNSEASCNEASSRVFTPVVVHIAIIILITMQLLLNGSYEPA